MSDNEQKIKTAQQAFFPYGLPYGYPAFAGPVAAAPQAEAQATQPAPVVYVPYPVYGPHPWHHHGQPEVQAVEQKVEKTEAPKAAAAEHEGGGFFASGLHKDALVKGVVIGAGLTYLLTNETVQKNLIGAAVRLWATLQGGVEEVKERFRDAEADLHATDDHR